MNKYLEEAFALKSVTIEDRRHLHNNPECGMILPQTKKYVVGRLEMLGLEPKFLGESGIVVSIKGNKDGKTILLRCDMDALPMEEINDLPFKSKLKNAAHTCGHDMHTAIMLSVAEILTKHKDKIKGTVKIVFEPGEEVLAGATMLINEGLLENIYDGTSLVDAAMALHVELNSKPGEISYAIGGAAASVHPFEIIIKGISCHGGMPHLGIDPIAAGVHVYQACLELLGREVPASEKITLTFGEFNSGNVSNAVPGEAILRGSLRGYNNTLCNKMVKRMKEILEGVEKMFNVDITYKNLFPPVPAVYNNPNFTKEIVNYIEDIGIKTIQSEGITGSEDFAFIAQEVPSALINLGAKVEGNDYVNHNPKVLFNEDCMPYGVATFVNCAINWLQNN